MGNEKTKVNSKAMAIVNIMSGKKISIRKPISSQMTLEAIV